MDIYAELTCSSRPSLSLFPSYSPGLLSLSIASSVRLGVQGNIGTTLYQSMSHSPPYPSSCLLLHCLLHTTVGVRYNPASWLTFLVTFARVFLIPEHLSTRINLVFSSLLFPFPFFFFRASRTFDDSFEGSFEKRFLSDGDKFLSRLGGHVFNRV